MSGGWQISLGDVSETLRPALFALSVIASTWVLSDARRHGGFRADALSAWTLLTLLFAHVVLPLYLVARMFTPRPSPNATTEEPDQDSPDEDAASREDEESPEEASVADGGGNALKWRFALPLLYATALLLAGAIYFYRDYSSFDAHLMRAAQAKLYGRRERTITEYRAALRVQEDAHARKLLGLELLEAGRAEDALAELLAAERGGEPDERLPFRLASALDALGRRSEAAEAYGRFSRGALCAQSPPDTLCEQASARLQTLSRASN